MNILDDDYLKDMMQYDILSGDTHIKKRPFTDEEIEVFVRKIYNIPDDDFLNIDESYKTEIRNQLSIQKDEVALKSQKFGNEKILSFEDKELLIEYAPKLFNTWDNVYTLKQVMFNFVDKVYRYKLLKSPTNINYNLNAELSTKYANDNKKKIESLSNHLREALDLMSRKLDVLGGRVGTTIEDNFRDKLPKYLANRQDETVGNLVVNIISEIIQNPEKFIIKKIPIQTTEKKNDIKNYLINLKLEGKSEEINNFMKAIK